MKELSIEEKAKRYDEALKKAVVAYKDEDRHLKATLERIYPELKESEDEIVRKSITEFFKNFSKNGTWKAIPDVTKWIAWLEKQGEQKVPDVAVVRKELNEHLKPQSEQKPADKVEPKFHEGDWVVCGSDIDRVERVTDRFYHFESGDCGLIKDVDEDYHLWTIQDEKDGDVLCYKDEILLYKHDIKNCTKQGTTFGGFVYHCCYDGKRFIVDSLYSLTEQDKTAFHPATKEQRDLLFQKMKEAGYEWDAEKKELKKIEDKPLVIDEGKAEMDKNFTEMMLKDYTKQKPAWSEEDEYKYNTILHHLDLRKEKFKKECNQEEQDSYQCLYDWLKSLKDRYTWKPSDEQLYWLKWAANRMPDTEKANEAEAVLEELLEQLKKLREE